MDVPAGRLLASGEGVGDGLHATERTHHAISVQRGGSQDSDTTAVHCDRAQDAGHARERAAELRLTNIDSMMSAAVLVDTAATSDRTGRLANPRTAPSTVRSPGRAGFPEP